MTAQDLFNELKQIIDNGYGQAEIMFDTDAKTWDYHMAKVGVVYLLTDVDPDSPIVYLGEK